MMKKILIKIICFLTIITILSGCIENTNQENTEEETPQQGDIRLISTEYLGGKYNLSFLHKQSYYDEEWSNFTLINYTKNGKTYTGAYKPEMEYILNWIKNNTSENCTILCWWDYGHMVEGYAERNALATFASINLIDTIARFASLNEEEKSNKIKEIDYWAPNENLADIANIFTSINLTDVKDIIEKYNISYILTHEYDKNIAYIFFKYFDKNTDEYLVNNSLATKAKQTMIFQLWADNYVPPGLKLIYDSKFPEMGYYYYYSVRFFEIT